MIIDTHAHFDDEAFDQDREAAIAALPAHGVYAAVNMAADLSGARDSAALAEKYPYIWCGIGLHPDHVGLLERGWPDPDKDSGEEKDSATRTDESASAGRIIHPSGSMERIIHPSGSAERIICPSASAAEVLSELYALAKSERCVCIGEIGLDYHWDIEPREVQKKWFAEQINMAQELGLPFNVHSRNAAQDTFDIVKTEDGGKAGGIIHCFSGSREMAREYVKMGYFLGIGGAVTFKNSKTLKKVVEDTPIEFLVTETDCPYMTPEPYRGRRNSSINISYVIDAIASLKQMDREETEQILFENAKRAYPRLGQETCRHNNKTRK